jgi:hypothetical protein
MLLAVSIVFIWRISMASSQSGRVLLPDLAFRFDCAERDRSVLENDIEKFLRNEGFRVLNRGRIQRKHNVFLSEIDIVGLDDKRRIVDVNKFITEKTSTYSVSLLSPPPTQRSPQFEEALLVFVKEKLMCNVRQVSRNQNGPEAIDFFNNEVKRIEGLFRQAEDLKGQRRI